MEPFLTWLSVLSTFFFFLNSVSWFWDHWTSRFQACFTGWHCKCSCQSLCSRPWEGSFALTIFSLCCFFPPLFFVLAILRIIETWKHFAKVKEPVTWITPSVLLFISFPDHYRWLQSLSPSVCVGVCVCVCLSFRLNTVTSMTNSIGHSYLGYGSSFRTGHYLYRWVWTNICYCHCEYICLGVSAFLFLGLWILADFRV